MSFNTPAVIRISVIGISSVPVVVSSAVSGTVSAVRIAASARAPCLVSPALKVNGADKEEHDEREQHNEDYQERPAEVGDLSLTLVSAGCHCRIGCRRICGAVSGAVSARCAGMKKASAWR